MIVTGRWLTQVLRTDEVTHAFAQRTSPLWKAVSLSASWEYEMQVALELLEAQVLKLPADDRARLLDRLVLSLDADAGRDEAWDALAAQRDAEIESGQIAEVDGAQALARLRARYR